MASSYPGSLDSFTTKTNKQDDVDASHMNDVQNAIVAVQTELGTDPAGTLTDLKTRLAVMMHTNGAVAQGTSFPVSPSPVEGQMFYRTDENAFYIYNGSGWDSFTSHTVQVYTSDDTFTVPGGVTKVLVTMVGGGGGGGGGGSSSDNDDGGGGGGGAAIINVPYTVTPAAELTVTVGAAGAAGTSSTDGGDGGDSVFDNLTVSGGNKGLKGTGGSAGNGGAAIAASSMTGAVGTTGNAAGGLMYTFPSGGGGNGGGGVNQGGGGGGGSMFGPGGTGGNHQTAGNAPTLGFGGGGGGGGGFFGTGTAGGAGSQGLVVLIY